jgi:hypothetical protein
MNLLEKLAFHIAFDTFILCHAVLFAIITLRTFWKEVKKLFGEGD